MHINEMRKVVEGAPDGATHIADGDYHKPQYPYVDSWREYKPSGSGTDWPICDCIYNVELHNLTDLRAIIAQHDRITELEAAIRVAVERVQRGEAVLAAFDLEKVLEVE